MLLKVMTRCVNRNSYLAVPATLRVQRNQSGAKVQIRRPARPGGVAARPGPKILFARIGRKFLDGPGRVGRAQLL